MITNLFFDFFEIIANGMYGPGAMGRIVETRLGIPLDEYCRKDTGESWELWKKLNRGELDEKAYWEIIIKTHDWKAKPEDFIQCARESLKVPIPGTYEILEQLHDCGYRMYLVSDVWEDMRKDMFRAYPWIDDIFTKCYFSYEMHSLKSDEGHFERICKDCGAIPSESLFVDDYDVNVSRAKSIGMQGIVFKNADQLRHDIIDCAIGDYAD